MIPPNHHFPMKLKEAGLAVIRTDQLNPTYHHLLRREQSQHLKGIISSTSKINSVLIDALEISILLHLNSILLLVVLILVFV